MKLKHLDNQTSGSIAGKFRILTTASVITLGLYLGLVGGIWYFDTRSKYMALKELSYVVQESVVDDENNRILLVPGGYMLSRDLRGSFGNIFGIPVSSERLHFSLGDYKYYPVYNSIKTNIIQLYLGNRNISIDLNRFDSEDKDRIERQFTFVRISETVYYHGKYPFLSDHLPYEISYTLSALQKRNLTLKALFYIDQPAEYLKSINEKLFQEAQKSMNDRLSSLYGIHITKLGEKDVAVLMSYNPFIHMPEEKNREYIELKIDREMLEWFIDSKVKSR